MTDTPYKPIAVGDWMLTLILLAIPFVNIAMLIYWIVSPAAHPSKRSYAIATLILFGIILIFVVVAIAIPTALQMQAPKP